MTRKEKLLFVCILVVMVFSFLFSHFWGCTVYALGKFVAFGIVSLAGLAKSAAGICGVHLLP